MQAIKLRVGEVIDIPLVDTRVQITSATPDNRTTPSIIIQGDIDNSGNIFVGDETVTILNGFALGKSSAIEIAGDPRQHSQDELVINDLYVVGDKINQKARVFFITRRSNGIN